MVLKIIKRCLVNLTIDLLSCCAIAIIFALLSDLTLIFICILQIEFAVITEKETLLEFKKSII